MNDPDPAPAPRLVAAAPTLVGALVTLRPFTGEDTPAMAGILADAELVRLTGSAHSTAQIEAETITTEQLHPWYSTRAEQEDRLDLAIVDRTTGGVVGEVVLNEWEPDNACCNFRTLIGPAGRGRGLGTEATRLIVDHGFRVLGLHRIQLEVYSFNPRARRVYEQVGFVHEGTRRAAMCFDGAWVDAEIMAILAAGWAPTA